MNYTGLSILGSMILTLSFASTKLMANVNMHHITGNTLLLQTQNSTIDTTKKVEIAEVHIKSSQRAIDSRTTWQLSQGDLRENMGKDLAHQLANIPGVAILKTGANISKPIINGLYGSRIIMLNNGVKHESQQWGNDHAPEIDPFFFQQISVIKNADAVRYGAEAMGGIIRLEPNPISDKKLKGQINIIGNSNGRGGIVNTILEGTKDKFKFRGSITAGKAGNLKTPSYYLGNTGKEELHSNLQFGYTIGQWNLDLRLSQFNSKIGLFEGAHIGSIDDILARINSDEPFEEYNFSYSIRSPRQQVNHQMGKLNATKVYSEGKKLEFTYSYQRNGRKEFDLRRVASDDTPMANLKLHTQQIEAIYHAYGAQLGFSGSLQVNNNIAGTGTTPLIPNFDNYNTGLFFKNRHQIGNSILEYGARYDYRYFDVAGYRYDHTAVSDAGIVNTYLLQETRHFHNISGAIGISHTINPGIQFKSNASLAWRAPNANELYADGIHHGTGTYEIGNPNLLAERGLKWMNSLEAQYEKFDFKLDLYTQLIDNYIYSNPAVDSVKQTIRGTYPVFLYKQTNALFFGFDAQLNWQPTNKLGYTINASWIQAKDITQDRYLPYIPAFRLMHQLTLQLTDHQTTNSYIKLGHQYVAKQKRYELDSDFAAPPAGYHLVDFAAHTKLFSTEKSAANIIFQIDNLFNTKYRDYLDRMRYYSHAQGRNLAIKLQYTF